MTFSALNRIVISVSAVAALAACGAARPPIDTPGAIPQVRTRSAVPEWQARHLARTFCPQVVGRPTCLALQVTKNEMAPPCSPSSGCGWTPLQLEIAYNIKNQLSRGAGTNVAVIEAGDLADASSDLATYRNQFGLGRANLTKYNEHGQKSDYPPSCENYGWCLETDLDIDMVSAACPKCNIFLLEAKSGTSDFEKAETEAVTLGATILSNSWICYGSADCGDSDFSNYFDTPGVAYLASSGDAAFNSIGAPAALDSVIAVGGTQLAVKGSRYSERIWNDAGAGCANPDHVGGSGVRKPSWQKDPDCEYRTIGDISSESGCSPGVAVYISSYGGWTGVCGTSVASPFSAGVIALAGDAAKMEGGKTFWTAREKSHKRYFNHPTRGSDGSSCGDYLCGNGRYKTYYSGPGGWGAPNGIRGF